MLIGGGLPAMVTSRFDGLTCCWLRVRSNRICWRGDSWLRIYSRGLDIGLRFNCTFLFSVDLGWQVGRINCSLLADRGNFGWRVGGLAVRQYGTAEYAEQ